MGSGVLLEALFPDSDLAHGIWERLMAANNWKGFVLLAREGSKVDITHLCFIASLVGLES